jgi:hypothetical protein
MQEMEGQGEEEAVCSGCRRLAHRHAREHCVIVQRGLVSTGQTCPAGEWETIAKGRVSALGKNVSQNEVETAAYPRLLQHSSTVTEAMRALSVVAVSSSAIHHKT